MAFFFWNLNQSNISNLSGGVSSSEGGSEVFPEANCSLHRVEQPNYEEMSRHVYGSLHGKTVMWLLENIIANV